MAKYGRRNRRIMWPSPSAIQAARKSRKPAPILIEPTPPVLLLVLDTNVVLDWVAFRDPRVQPIAAAIERGTLRAATSGACLQELRRALSYAQVKLDAAAQALAFERYAAHAMVFDIPEPAAATGLPRCEDVDDQKFLDLAWHTRASHLVTRDKALLKLARQLVRAGRFTVLAPDAFLRWARGLLRR
jgi:putative PIN family toxin of toxin-antitoxin system